MKAGKAIKKSIQHKQDELAPEQVTFAPERETDIAQQPPRQEGVIDEQFPTDALHAPRSKEDELWATKLQLQGKDGAPPGVTPFGILDAKDSDFKRLLEKQALQEEANFQAWFAKWFDYASPAQKKRAKELFPSYYEQRARLLRKQADNLYNYARLKLTGVENEHDLLTQYAAETGRLDIGPLNHLLNPEQADGARNPAWQQAKFQRGMWSPFRIFGDEAVRPGESESEMRMASGQAWAERNVPPQTYLLGTEVAVPPTLSNAQNQGTGVWWQVLQNAVRTQPPAAAATAGGEQ